MISQIKGWETLTPIFETIPLINAGTCAFTGHRPSKFPWKYDESNPRCVALKQKLYDLILDLVNHGFSHFLSGMAMGTDLWAAYDVLDIRQQYPSIKLHCILPCFEQTDKWGIPYKQQYQDILSKADTVVRVQRQYTKECYMERNRFMVNAASLILAVYDGQYRSGTGATVRYANSLGKKIMILNPVTLQISS